MQFTNQVQQIFYEEFLLNLQQTDTSPGFILISVNPAFLLRNIGGSFEKAHIVV